MSAPRVCRLDFETRSRIDLIKRGTYVYAADSSTEVLMASYSFDDGATIRRWRIGQPCPDDLAAHVKAGGEIHAWNAQFERLIWWHCLPGWPRPKLEQFKCTAAVARALSLPGSLDKIGQALQLPAKKDKEGSRLIKLFSVPQPDGSFTPPEGPEFERFHDYCDQDVRTEGAAAKQMIPLSNKEWAAYHLGERINDRGIRIDTQSAFAALRIVQQAKEAADSELFRLTDGAVEKHSQGARLVAWLQSRGVPAEKAARQDLEALLEDPDTPDDARLAMTLRLLASKAAVGKLNTMLTRVSRDSRSRGNFLFYGAGTGRFSSLGWQAHNLARPRIIFAKASPEPATLFRAIRQGDASLLPLLYGDELGKPMHLMADAMRSFLWADPGKELMVADYSGIEGALTAWFCREEWKIEAMAELLTPEGKKKPDMYLRAAGGIFGVPAESIPKSDDRRQIGKVSELSLGYEGGVSAFYSMARNYGLDLSAAYVPVWAAASDERRANAEKRLKESTTKGHAATKLLSREAWLAAELVKVGWRATHPMVVEGWKILKNAAAEAVENPGVRVAALGVTFLVQRGFLWCLLPSGRVLAYGAPSIREVEVPWADQTKPKSEREKQPAVTVLGTSGGKLMRYALYGGLLMENIIQALARDILVHGMHNAERLGYATIMHVHDEVIAEVPRGWGDEAEFKAALLDLEPWCTDLPLGVGDIHRMKRYRKA
jgi:DNA polymerase